MSYLFFFFSIYLNRINARVTKLRKRYDKKKKIVHSNYTNVVVYFKRNTENIFTLFYKFIEKQVKRHKRS